MNIASPAAALRWWRLPAKGIGSSLRVGAAGLDWQPVGGASRYTVWRGTIPMAGGMASRALAHDHACVGTAMTTSFTEADAPSATEAFYYLVQSGNDCGDASSEGLGHESTGDTRPNAGAPGCP